MQLYPLKFTPQLAERIWGGQTLARYGKTIPAGQKIGESWEISDRDDAQSMVANGPLAGQTLRQLIARFGADLLGTNVTPRGSALSAATALKSSHRGTEASPTLRFPLLIKLLDARARLSLQVHPPATVAPRLGGEPKTEMWYIMDAAPDAHLIAGLKRGVTRAQFEQALAAGTLAELVHRFPVKAGDALFVPSGRIHAIDAGLVIAEIQQNSDTTYRVFDWGRPRPLHAKESLASIDFNDHEPSPVRNQPVLADCPHFRVEKLTMTGNQTFRCDQRSFQILGCVAGAVTVHDEPLRAGEFILLPATLGQYQVAGNGTLLRTTV